LKGAFISLKLNKINKKLRKVTPMESREKTGEVTGVEIGKWKGELTGAEGRLESERGKSRAPAIAFPSAERAFR